MGSRENGGTDVSRKAWYAQQAAAIVQRLASDPLQGLERGEAARRLADEGPNIITPVKGHHPLVLFMRQFTDFMIVVLLAAAVVSGVVGELQDTVAILVIVLLNALISTVQEYRAERAVAALRRLSAPMARVVRDGAVIDLPAADLVSGDVVLLEAGARVPADLRLLEAAELRVDESLLTGESQVVDKHTDVLGEPDLPAAEQRNMLFASTLVANGRGRGVVVATGMQTQIGAIAGMLRAERGSRTPLQQRLARFGRRLALAVLAVCVVVFAAGLLQGEPAPLMFLTAVSLAVAAIPEALPAVVTIALAFGARVMGRHNALVRRLPAVETLGSVTYICADKTGTLTQNRMSVERLLCAGEEEGELPPVSSIGESVAWQALAEALALSNDVATDASGEARGEATELALYEAAQGAGIDVPLWREQWPRLAELPFDAERKRMSTLHRHGEGVRLYCKGSPEQLLPLCSGRLKGDGSSGAVEVSKLLTQAEALAAQGYRVLAMAMRDLAELPGELEAERLENELLYVGLVAIIDPPRPEVPKAVAHCRAAGITPVMITGDHPATAQAIARRLGIIADGDGVLTGQELAEMSEQALAAQVKSVRVYARVTPRQKIAIVSALQSHGEFVAMTGDGVNDAPALKRADIGVAMGDKGTDVAREAADMVLLDDNFATIVAAVREGRRIFDNIRKFIKYTMTSNAGEIWTLFLAPFLGMPIPLLPIHILWINLVTDGLPGLALTAEPEESKLLKRPPRPPGESVFAHGMWQHILWVGLLIGGLSLLAQAWALEQGGHWQTMVFTVLTFAQLVHVLAIRSERESLFSIGLWSNRPLLLAVLASVGLQLAVIYLPALNPIFKTAPLSAVELLLCFALALVVLLAVEVEKWLVRRGRIYAA